MAKDDEQQTTEGGKKSSKKLIILGVGGVVLVALIVGATLFFTGFFEAEPEAEQAEQSEQAEPLGEAVYQKLEPAFLVNFQNKPGARVMQVEISVMARDAAVIEAVNQHSPVIRNNILLLLSGQDPESLKTTDGKVALQGLIVEEINKILSDHAVKNGVESVFFTSLVMQ